MNKLQKKVDTFVKEKNLDADIAARTLDLVSEIGEIAKEVLKGSNYGEIEFKKTEDWENEIGDVLFSLICLANQTGVNLENSLNTALEKYEKRFESKGDVGSGR